MDNTKTAEEILNELNSKRAVKWEGLSDGGKWSRAIDAMEEYAFHLKKRIEELERAVGATIPILELLGHPSTAKELKTILHPSTNGK